MSTASWLSRRTALKGLAATGVGLVAGPIGYGVAIERHRVRLIEQPLP